jgi:hypothetical protein
VNPEVVSHLRRPQGVRGNASQSEHHESPVCCAVTEHSGRGEHVLVISGDGDSHFYISLGPFRILLVLHQVAMLCFR